jgi:hypothetical protein
VLNGSGAYINGTTGSFYASATGTQHFFNRQEDGNILSIRRLGSDSGNIGTNSAKLYISSTGNSGLKFRDDLNCIMPCNADGSNSDADQDLGQAGVRFKNLYLSGGIRLGGTGTANELDDYEEGVFVMSTSTSGYTIADQSGFYTKIGRKVTVLGHLTFDPVGTTNSSITLGGLPFTSGNLDADIAYVGVARETVVSGDIFVAQVARATSTFGINSMDGVANGSNQIFVANRNIVFNITYFV